MGSGQPQQQTTTQVLSPEQRQLMNLAMPGVTQFAASVPQRYQGSTIAPFDPSQVAGQEGALTAAGTQTDLGQAGAGTSESWLSPGATDVSNSPIVQGNINAALTPLRQGLTETTLPAIRSSAEQTGNFGSSRQGIAEGLAAGRESQAEGSATANILNNAYNTNVDAQLKALGLLPSTQGAQTVGAATTSDVGDIRQNMAQALLGQDVSNFNYSQYAPFLQSQEIMSLLSGLPGGGTTSTSNVPASNPLLQGLGGAAAGASLGSAIMPGVGTAAGAGIGALLPFLTR
jgi:hypothetical protein